jgi:hypothetical protein
MEPERTHVSGLVYGRVLVGHGTGDGNPRDSGSLTGTVPAPLSNRSAIMPSPM